MDTIESPTLVVEEPAKAPGLLRRAVRPLRIVSFIFIGFLLLAVVLASVFEKQIGQKLISILSESLETELTVEDFDFSFIKNFPKASAELQTVDLLDLNGTSLLRAESVSFNLGLFSLFAAETKIPSVKISDGTVFLQFDKNGKGNYNIVKTSNKREKKDFTIDLEKALFENVTVIYTDWRGPHEVKIKIDEGHVAGVISDSEFDLDIVADLQSEFINLDHHKYLVDKPLTVAARLNVDVKERLYTFTKAKLNIEENPLLLGGSIQATKEATKFDLQVLTKKGDVATIISFLPKQYTAYISDFKSTGDLNMVAKIRGPLSATRNPAIDILFGLNDGKISSKRFGQSIRNVKFKGKFTNGQGNKNKTSLLQVKDFAGNFRGEPLTFDLSIRNLDRPYLNMRLNGKLATADIVEMIDTPELKKGDGALHIKKVGIKGAISDLMNPARMNRVEAMGIVDLKDVSFRLNKELMEIEDGRFALKGNKLSVSKLNIKAVDSDINLSGNCYNLIPVLMADSTHKDDIRLKFNGQLTSSNLDLDALTTIFSTTKNETQSKTSGNENQFLTQFLQGNFSATVNQFHYNKIKGTAFKGELEIEENEVMIEGNARGMGGDWILDGTIFLEDKINASTRLSCTNINIREFFKQSNNFGQKVLRSEHLEGQLMANLKIDVFWDEEGKIDLREMVVLGDVAIQNGQLNNFEMLYSFSKYIKSQDLRRIRFTTLRNWLEVKNGRISIPNMFVQSNALNLELCGLHTFDNKIDYNFKINAGQVLVNKFKRHNPELVPVRAQREGLFNLYYRVNGSIDNYRVKQDARYVKRKLKSTRKRKIAIQNKLTREFGTLNIPEENWNNPPPYFKHDSTDEIIVEEELPKVQEENFTTDSNGLTPSADDIKPNNPVVDLINQLEEQQNSEPNLPVLPLLDDDDEEFLDFEIEGKNLKQKKEKGN